MKKKKCDYIYLKRVGEGEIPIINTHGELWSGFKMKVLKTFSFRK